jgi:hypothetical protein
MSPHPSSEAFGDDVGDTAGSPQREWLSDRVEDFDGMLARALAHSTITSIVVPPRGQKGRV